MTGVFGSTPDTRVTFGGVDISDMILTVKDHAPWLHFSWGTWEDVRDLTSEAMRTEVDPHQGHDLLVRYGWRATEFQCRTCQAVADRAKLAETIRAARVELEGPTA